MFNKYDELKEGELKDGIKTLAQKLNFPLTKVLRVDGSKSSEHSNAYYFGFGNNKRIVIFDTLIDTHSNDEIIGIICHELGHW